jgi:hypothetical protein
VSGSDCIKCSLLVTVNRRRIFPDTAKHFGGVGGCVFSLYLPIKKDGVLVRVDCAQAFLFRTTNTPTPGEEALAVAFVHPKSFTGFNVVSRKADPTSPVFGRTPVMIFDGLSILQKPFFRGELTEDVRQLIRGETDSADFLLVDGGNYLGRTFWVEGETGRKEHISLSYRLNPDQPDGRFHGSLDVLAS